MKEGLLMPAIREFLPRFRGILFVLVLGLLLCAPTNAVASVISLDFNMFAQCADSSCGSAIISKIPSVGSIVVQDGIPNEFLVIPGYPYPDHTGDSGVRFTVTTSVHMGRLGFLVDRAGPAK
jgi:hypothetical protein